MAFLRVTAAFVDFSKGRPEVFNPGRLVNGDDPVTKGREAHFEPVEVAAARASGVVEQATAAPGEKRSVSAPKKAAPKKPKPADE